MTWEVDVVMPTWPRPYHQPNRTTLYPDRGDENDEDNEEDGLVMMMTTSLMMMMMAWQVVWLEWSWEQVDNNKAVSMLNMPLYLTHLTHYTLCSIWRSLYSIHCLVQRIFLYIFFRH